MSCIFPLAKPERENAGQKNIVLKSQPTEEIFDCTKKSIEVDYIE